jgi:uncharacterized phage protein gp47/JayE
MARVYSGAVHLLYEYLDYQSEQLFAARASVDGLEAIADEYGLSRTAAIKATGQAVATGTNGTVIAANTELQSSAGERYVVDAAVTVAAGTATMALTASTEGADGNESAGGTLTFVSPIAGVSTEATIDSSGITGGLDEETDDDLRERVLARKRFPPHGGSEHDYEAWALEYPGVTRAWVFPEYQGVGTVGLTFVMDNATPYIPIAATRALVRGYLVEHEDPSTGQTIGIPVTAEPGLFVFEITEVLLHFLINIYPNTADVKAAVTAELTDFFLREGGPGETIRRSRLSEAISLSLGEGYHEIIFPASDVVVGQTEIYSLGVVNFSDY